MIRRLIMTMRLLKPVRSTETVHESDLKMVEEILWRHKRRYEAMFSSADTSQIVFFIGAPGE